MTGGLYDQDPLFLDDMITIVQIENKIENDRRKREEAKQKRKQSRGMGTGTGRRRR